MENHNCSVYVIGILAFVFDNQSCFFFSKKIIYCVYVNIMISTAMFWLLAKNKARCWHFMWTEPSNANHYPCEAQMSKRGTEGLRTLPRIKRKITSEAGISNFWTEKQNVCRPGCALWCMERNEDRGYRISRRLPTCWRSSSRDLTVFQIWSCRAGEPGSLKCSLWEGDP